jgi:hypothetical protein
MSGAWVVSGAWVATVPAPGFLEDERMTRALDKEGLRSWLNVPVFCDPKYLERRPDAYAITNLGRRAAQDWLQFVCPSRDDYLDGVIEALRRHLTRLSPAVVSLDFTVQRTDVLLRPRAPTDGAGIRGREGARTLRPPHHGMAMARACVSAAPGARSLMRTQWPWR